MSSKDRSNDIPNLDEIAAQELLNEAKRGAARASIYGALGWQKCPLKPTNKVFLQNMLLNNISSNSQKEQVTYTKRDNVVKRKVDEETKSDLRNSRPEKRKFHHHRSIKNESRKYTKEYSVKKEKHHYGKIKDKVHGFAPLHRHRKHEIKHDYKHNDKSK